jgi:DNA-binding PadR family transcriptional regulator
MPRALSCATALVLDALARGYRYGFDILDATGLPGGTVYPILRRLEHDAMASSRWESARIAQSDLRPPRRYYALTPLGEQALKDARERYPMLARVPAGRTSPKRT